MLSRTFRWYQAGQTSCWENPKHKTFTQNHLLGHNNTRKLLGNQYACNVGNSMIFLLLVKWFLLRTQWIGSIISMFFPYGLDPLLKGSWCTGKQPEVTKYVSLVKIAEKKKSTELYRFFTRVRNKTYLYLVGLVSAQYYWEDVLAGDYSQFLVSLDRATPRQHMLSASVTL